MLHLTGFITLPPNFNEGDDKLGILTADIGIDELLNVYRIDHMINRDIDYNRVGKLSNYIQQLDTELGIYMPAIITAYEGEEPERADNLFAFNPTRDFVVIDGQHRIKALEDYIEKETDQSKIDKVLQSRITIQVYFGLEDWMKRQLFIEINGKAKKVTKNLSVKYDDRNAINTLITDLLKNKRNNPLLKMGVEMEKARVVRPNNINWISMIRLSRFISFLLFGTNAVSTSNNEIVESQYEHIFSFLQQYFMLLEYTLPKNPGEVNDNILGHEAIQNSIALLCNEEFVRREKKQVVFVEDWKDKIEMLGYIDWKTNSSLFKDHIIKLGSGNKYSGFSDSKHYNLLPLLKKQFNLLLN